MLSPTVLPRAQRVQNLYMHARMVDACDVGQGDANRLAVSVALLARAAAAPPQKGQVLSPTGLLQAERVQKLYMHACMVEACEVGQGDVDRLAVSVALLARAAAAPEIPSEGQVLSPTDLPRAQRETINACLYGDACDGG